MSVRIFSLDVAHLLLTEKHTERNRSPESNREKPPNINQSRVVRQSIDQGDEIDR